MKARIYDLLNFLWTILYFVYWETLYITGFGLVIGTAVFPVVGTAAGAFVGAILGIGLGLVLGVVVGVLHSLHFRSDTDLTVYRRQLGQWMGRIVIILGIVGLFGAFGEAATDQGHINDYWTPVEWLFALSLSGICLLAVSLSSAYVARYYPDQIIKRLIHQERESSEGAAMLLEWPGTNDRAEAFLSHFYPMWMHIIAGLIGLVLCIVLNWPTTPALGIFVGLIGFFALAFYLALANSLCLTTLKAVVFEDLLPDVSPHRLRVSLTVISFVITLIGTWWTAIFAPILAAYIAYHAYHTLALPNGDFAFEKAKRKEKISATQS